MEKNELPDLVMDGVNTAAGGRYHSVSINGVSKINGALSAHTYSCDGVMKQNGDLSAEELEMNGTLNLKGNLQVGGMKLNGVVNGEGSLRGERCEMDGMLKLKGNCELEELTGAGVFTVGGLLSAGRIEFGLQGHSEAVEIGVESLVIRKKRQRGLGQTVRRYDSQAQNRAACQAHRGRYARSGIYECRCSKGRYGHYRAGLLDWPG
ncbi:hypothetical protein ACFTAO_28820 [Paenibacillus rhizoplanae]